MDFEWSLDVDDDELTINFLVDNLVYEGELAVIAADAGIGKTTFCLQLLDAVTNGKSFFGLKVNNPQLCLWLNNEMTKGLFKKRANQLTDKTGFHLLTNKIKLFEEEQMKDLSNSMLEKGIKVLFIDSLAQSCAGVDENDNGLYSQILGDLRKYFCNKGITVFLIHHLAKSQFNNSVSVFDISRLRGASSINANADSIFIMGRMKDNSLRIESVKSRYNNQFKLDFYFNNEGKLVTSDLVENNCFNPIVFDKKTIEDEIITLLKKNNSLNQLEITKSLFHGRNIVIATLNKFEGKLWKKEKISKAFVYTLIEEN